jgi:hypothetical protein
VSITCKEFIQCQGGLSSHVLEEQSYSPARVPVHLGSLVFISRCYLTSSSQQNAGTPRRCHFATLLGGLLLCRLVQVDIAMEGASVLALQAPPGVLLPVLPLSVAPGAILVVGAALLVAAVARLADGLSVVLMDLCSTAIHRRC